jgi:hypothetical protein
MTSVAADRDFLFLLQRQALRYFLENQAGNGLMLDRQSNHGPRRSGGLCSLTATGMGFIALALASAPPYRLLTPADAVRRIETGLNTALHALPHERGVMPHFVDSVTQRVHGVDYLSTIESAWLAAGALWAAEFLGDGNLQALAESLYRRIDFRYWTALDVPGTCGLLRHGMDRRGQFLTCCWDRLNGETVFLYVLAAGAADDKAWPASFWPQLGLFYGETAGLRFNNADLGLFVFQYGLDLLDFRQWRAPNDVDLAEEAQRATWANQRLCREKAAIYRTYRTYWGLSAGDGPDASGRDSYRCYAPSGPIDGTAHLTATVASFAHAPEAVLDNLYQAQRERSLRIRGRYGFSNVNLDRQWVGGDMVGIDAGAMVLALDNALMENRVRVGFHRLPCVQYGLARLDFYRHSTEMRRKAA